jgi:hypothetical protein
MISSHPPRAAQLSRLPIVWTVKRQLWSDVVVQVSSATLGQPRSWRALVSTGASPDVRGGVGDRSRLRTAAARNDGHKFARADRPVDDDVPVLSLTIDDAAALFDLGANELG